LLVYPDRQQPVRVQELAGLLFFRLEWELRFGDRSLGSDPSSAARAVWVQEEQTLFPLDQSLLSAWRRLLGDERDLGSGVTYPRLRTLAEPNRLNLAWRLVYASALASWIEAQLQLSALSDDVSATRLLRGLSDVLQNSLASLRDFLGIRGTRVDWSGRRLDLLQTPSQPRIGETMSAAQLGLFAEVATLCLVERRLHLLWSNRRDNFSYPGMPASMANTYAQLWRPSLVREYLEVRALQVTAACVLLLSV